MIQRVLDWLHEREIARLKRAVDEAVVSGDRAKARHFWNAFVVALLARSPAQVARMERRYFRRMDAPTQRFFLKHGGSSGGAACRPE